MIDTVLGRHPGVRHAQLLAARALFRLGLTPNRATALALAAGILAGVSFGAGATAAGAILLATSALLDAVDGTIAREIVGGATPLGGVLDLCADRVVEAAAIVGIAWRRAGLGFPALVLVATWYINITVFLVAGAVSRAPEHLLAKVPPSDQIVHPPPLERGPKIIAYPPGLVERTEGIVFLIVLAAAPAAAGAPLCYGYAAIELIVAAQRALFTWRTLSPAR